MISSTQTGPVAASRVDGSSFDDDVRSFAQGHARILRELGYRTEATHVDRFVDRQMLADAAPAA